MKSILGLTLLVLVAVPVLMAQNPEDMTRKLWDTAFTGSSTAKKNTRRRASSYRLATPNVPTNNVAPETVVGVTLWRLRPARQTDSGERLIVHDDNSDNEWIPERISASTRLVQGDKLRISVEAVRGGYLYVIDREQYADGSLGEPYLIFPTTRTAGGDNSVGIGRLVEIPAQDDNPRTNLRPRRCPAREVWRPCPSHSADDWLARELQPPGPRPVKFSGNAR